MPKKKEETKKEKERVVSMYDPTADAFREIPISLAQKFVESAREVAKKLEEEED